MPELNPRRVNSTKGRFAQVSAAVLAGMAAMFVLQNVIEFRREAARPPMPAAAEPSSEPEPQLDLPVPEGIKRQAGPVASSMMLKPEEGLSETGATVVGVSGEEAPPKFEFKAPPPPDAPKAKKKEMPRLTTRTMDSKFASTAARMDGRFTEFHKKAAPPEEYKPFVPQAAAPEKARAAGSTAMTLIERATATALSENLQPALAAQITVPDVVFWTKARKINVGLAVVIMILGVLYLVYASGVRDAPPERAEGEL